MKKGTIQRGLFLILPILVLPMLVCGCYLMFPSPIPRAYFDFTRTSPFQIPTIAAKISPEPRFGNEIVSLDVWPLAGLGIGLIGSRAYVFPFCAGLGVFGFPPVSQAVTTVPASPAQPAPENMENEQNDNAKSKKANTKKSGKASNKKTGKANYKKASKGSNKKTSKNANQSGNEQPASQDN